MKKEKDIRVNKNFVSIREYILYFFVLSAFNGFHMWIYQILYRGGIIQENPQLSINLLMIFVMVTAAVVVGIIGFVRDRLMINPMRKLSDAARKIAKGDFSIRVMPRRKGSKKDFFDVMIDDFNIMAEELESIETLQNDFIANVSHEIKTPLSIIQAYSTALQSSDITEDKRMEYTQTILEASQKLTMLVTNILKLNKLENQEILNNAKPFDLSEQLRRCSLMFADQMEEKNICFEEDLNEVSVCYDENLPEIVWNNLISNAIKFSKPGDSVAISLKTYNDSMKNMVMVSITDTGCGMDKTVQKRIFDKFYQGDSSHSGEGNGLGLALVKKTIDLLGGTITVESTPEKGTAFHVCLKTN